MPMYFYQCEEGHLFEAIRPVANRDDPINCPKCNKPAKRNFEMTAREVFILIPKRHRADMENEAVRFVAGETKEEVERFKSAVESGKFVSEDAAKEMLQEAERKRQEEENERRITKELWEEAKRLTDGGRKLPEELQKLQRSTEGVV